MSICFKLLVLGSHQIVSGIASENGSQEYAKRMHVLKISDLERLQKSVPPAFSIGPQLIDSICRNFLNVLYCPFSEVTPMSQTLHVSPTKTIGADGRQSIRALCYTPGKDSRSCRARLAPRRPVGRAHPAALPPHRDAGLAGPASRGKQRVLRPKK